MRKNNIEKTAEAVGRFAFHAVRKTVNFATRMAWKTTKGLTKGSFTLGIVTVKFGYNLHKKKQLEKERTVQLDKQQELQKENKVEVVHHHHHHYYQNNTHSYQQENAAQKQQEKPAFQRQIEERPVKRVTEKAQKKPLMVSINKENTKELENKLAAREKRMHHIIKLAKTQRNIMERDYNGEETKQNAKELMDLYRKEFDILRNEGNVPLTFDPGSQDLDESVNYYTKSGLTKNQKMTSMQKGFIEAVNFGQDPSTFKNRFQDKYDVLLMDISKMHWAMENATSEKEKSYFAGRLMSMVTEENVKEIQDLKIPRRQRNYATEQYRAVAGNMRVREVPKEKDVIREAKELGEDIVEFAKRYSAEKSKSANYTKERTAVITANAQKQQKNLHFANKETQKTFYMGQKDTYTKPRFGPELF